MKHIGIFGGSFDPIHSGHLALAQSAVEELKLNVIYFVPAKISPFKIGVSPVSADHRIHMLKSVMFRVPKSKISYIEMKKQSPSFTVDTIEKFKKRFSKSKLFLIMGSDAYLKFQQWKEWDKILKMCTLVVGKRKGKNNLYVPQKRIPNVIVLKGTYPHISSTEFREEIRKGRKRMKGLPSEVFQYISAHHFY